MENYKYLENLKCQGQKWLSASRDRGQRSLSICQIVFSGSSLDRSHTELKTQSMQSVHRSNRDGLSYIHFCHSCPLIYVNFLTNERIFFLRFLKIFTWQNMHVHENNDWFQVSIFLCLILPSNLNFILRRTDDVKCNFLWLKSI